MFTTGFVYNIIDTDLSDAYIANIKTLQNKAFECVKKNLPNIVITGAYDVEDKIDEYDKRFGEFPTMAFEECEEEV